MRLLAALCGVLVIAVGFLLPKAMRAREERLRPASYVGSTSCRECHAGIYDVWSPSVHARAERLTSTSLDRQAFVPPHHVRIGQTSSSVCFENGEFILQTTGRDGMTTSFRPARIIGERSLRQLLVPFERGHVQVTSLAFDPNRKDWFDIFGTEDRQPHEWGHWANRGMNWNSMCGMCHNTEYRKNYDFATDSYATERKEMGVGCEACHGAGSTHVEWARGKRRGQTDPYRGRDKRQMFDTCGACHVRRSELTTCTVPAGNFLDHYLPELPGDNDIYYPDGQVRDEDFEYVSFRMSRMYHEGVRCMDCHEPHSTRRRAEGNALCLSCHQGKIDPATHGHHDLKQSGELCTSCHMPITPYMQRQPRHDHGFTIPDPHLTAEHGVPNACSRCHTDKSLQWVVTEFDKWYPDPTNRHSGRRARILARARTHATTAGAELISLARQDPYPIWRAIALGMLEPWGQLPETRETALAALKDPEALVRVKAVDLLAGMGPGIDESLKPLLADPVRAVRVRAAWALHPSLPADHPALIELQNYVEIGSDQPAGALMRGMLLSNRGQTQEAIGVLRRCVEWDPKVEVFWRQLAVTLSQAGQATEAVKVLSDACSQLTTSAELHYSLGLARGELQDWSGATQALRKATTLEPSFARAWYNLGLSLHRQRRLSEAVDALKRAQQLDPSNPDYPAALASITGGE